jgi:hypothetical protein
VTAVLLAHPIVEASSLSIRDSNEGWNAFQAERAFDSKPLYPKITALTSNNYPPLSFYIVGGLGSAIGDNIFAGRIIAFAGLVILGIGLGIAVRLMGGSAVLASFSGLLLVGVMAAFHSDYVAMNDPQWLAHAIMMFGLIVFLLRNGTRHRLFLAMLLMLGAGLVKHNLIPLPLAVTVWLFLHDRRNFYFWVLSSLLSLMGCMAIFYLAYGSDFFVSVFGAPRVYDAQRLPGRIDWLVFPLLLFIGAAIAFVAVTGARKHTQLVGLYILFAGVWGIFTLGGEGVDRNAIFDLVIAVILASGLAAQSFVQLADRNLSRRSAEVTAILIFSLPLLIEVPGRIITLGTFIETTEEQEALTRQDIAYIATADGPVMCAVLALCYWAGKSFEVDLSNLRHKLKTGALPERAFSAPIDDKYFVLIETSDDKGKLLGLPNSVQTRVLENYKLRQPRREHGAFLVPRGSE